MITCKECKYQNNCPAGWSYSNAACITIQTKECKILQLTDCVGHHVTLAPSEIMKIDYDPETDETYIMTKNSEIITINGRVVEE